MKKTVFCALLILSLALGVVAHAAVTEETHDVFKPEIFWNDGNDITGGGTDYPAGTLPTDDEPFDGLGEVGNGNRLKHFLANIPGGSSASAAKEDPADTDPAANIVLKAAGTVVFTDTKTNALANATMGIPNSRSLTKVHSIKVNFEDLTGTIGLFNFAKAGVNDELQDSNTAVLLRNGGVYMQKSTATAVEEVEVLPATTLAAETWYTVEMKHDVYASGYLAGKVTIKNENGGIIGESDWMRIGDGNVDLLSGLVLTSTCVMQNYTNGVTGVMFDDWTLTRVTGVSAKSTLTLVPDVNTSRTTHSLQITPAIGLVEASIADAITIDGMSADSYTVTYDDTTDSIIVTLNEALPFGETCAIKLSNDAFIETEEGFVAFDYSTIPLTYTVGPYADLFSVTVAADGTVTLSNADLEDREYLIITSLFRGSMYMGTQAVYGTITAGDTAGPGPIALPTFTGQQTGDTVKVIVWDNWENMYSLTDGESVTLP